MPLLELFPFRFRDPLTRKWVRARYVAERQEIVARYVEYEQLRRADSAESQRCGELPAGSRPLILIFRTASRELRSASQFDAIEDSLLAPATLLPSEPGRAFPIGRTNG